MPSLTKTLRYLTLGGCDAKEICSLHYLQVEIVSCIGIMEQMKKQQLPRPYCSSACLRAKAGADCWSDMSRCA